MNNSRVAIELNGRTQDMLVQPGTTLLSALRETLNFTATKRGCDQGGCGACTVIVDGKAVLSCLIPIETIAGARVETVEGLAPTGGLHPLQQAFLDGFATQCGFCTSGMMMAIKSLLYVTPDPSREDAVRAISGNVCRCTGYTAIIDAALDAAKLKSVPASKAA